MLSQNTGRSETFVAIMLLNIFISRRKTASDSGGSEHNEYYIVNRFTCNWCSGYNYKYKI